MRFPPSARSSILLGALATLALALRLGSEPFCVSRPAPAEAVEPRMVLRGRALAPFTLGNDAGARALTWARLAVDASYEPLARPGLSWEFGQLDAVTELDPQFASAYPFGSTFLSTFRRDEEGAERILRKWVKNQPRLWRAHAWLGYHLYFERNRPEEAGPFLLRAATLPGAPAWIAALGARMLSEAERLPQQLRRLVDLYPRVPPGIARERLGKRIRAVRFRYEQERLERAIAAFREKHRRLPASLGDVEAFLEPPSRAVASIADVGQENPAVRKELAALFAERFDFRYDRASGALHSDTDPEIERLSVHPRK